MTAEEMEIKIAEQATQIEKLSEMTSKIEEIESKVNPAPIDPDEAYKPKTWKSHYEEVESKAESAALKVLQDAEKKKDDLKKKEDDDLKAQNDRIDAAFTKLQEEGIIDETKDKDDLGGHQRTQILGMTLKTAGTDVESAARALKSAWDAGMEYDYQSNSFVRTGQAPVVNMNRMAPVGSSAARTPSAPTKGTINLQGVRGDLDEAQRRWELNNR